MKKKNAMQSTHYHLKDMSDPTQFLQKNFSLSLSHFDPYRFRHIPTQFVHFHSQRLVCTGEFKANIAGAVCSFSHFGCCR